MTAQTRHGSGQDWDDARKSALFADIVSLKLSIEEAASLHGLRVDVIQEWLRLFRRSALLAFDERLKKTLINQGANADELTAAEFTGHIEDVSIADLVQTIEIAGKDAVITVTHEGSDSHMWCSAGAIIDAHSGNLTGDAAVYRILGFERGRMVADLRPEPRVRTIYAATHRLLMEAARRKDEAALLEQKLGAEQYFRLCERPNSSRVHVSADELALLRLFEGAKRLREVVALSPLGDLETLGAIERLLQAGYLSETEAPASSRRAAPASAREPEPTLKLDPAELQSMLEEAQETNAPMSFVPMAVSHRPEPSRGRQAPRWMLAAVVASVLAPAAYWFGETLSNMRARQARAEAEAVAAAASQPEDARAAGEDMLQVSTTVQPAQAMLWLDQHPVATGRLEITLPRDGRTHLLRVAADGFIPATLMFADVPPPREIHLERLPTPSAEAVAPIVAPQPAPAHGAALEAARALPAVPERGSKSATPARRRPDGRARPYPRDGELAEPSRAAAAEPAPPEVQIIEDEVPAVRVIE